MTDKTDTDTPLTDALLRELASLCKSDERTIGLVYKSPIWDHARSLERQLAFKTEQAQTLMVANEEMERQLAAARKDSERLDWLFLDQEPYIVIKHGLGGDSWNEYIEDRETLDLHIRSSQIEDDY